MPLQEWNLRSSVFYKKIQIILWVLFILLIYRYFRNGYVLLGLIIAVFAIYMLAISYRLTQIRHMSFHGGFWKIDGGIYRCLNLVASNQYWMVIRGQQDGKSSYQRFVIFLDQFTQESEHAFRWNLKMNYSSPETPYLE